ncbi:restriction endonuclease subunit S [Streptococcus suis]|nr:restriction endonuclease subunit S [Streptococcus suis]
MKTNNNIPAYRFQGYTDAWELRKLGEVVEVCSGRDYKHLGVGSIPVYGTGGYMLSVSEALSKNNDAIGIGRKGTIDSPYILRAPFWTVDTLFYCIPNDGFTLEFAYSIFQNINWKSMDESTGVPSLSKNGINNVKVLTPKIKEQSAIGTFFSTLDRHITLHQRKLDTLKEQKKTYLKLLFPAKGQTKPALRFQGFEDDWEEVKLSDMILHEIKGKAKSEMLGSSAVYLETEYLNGGTKSFVDCEKDVEEDDILILWDGSQAGTVYHGFSGALGSTLKAYRPKESGKFIYYQLVSHQNLIFEKYRTPNIPHVIKTFTDEFHMFYTSHPEQEAIGSFFQTLDQEISQVEDKLASLKEMKKTLLRKLFV